MNRLFSSRVDHHITRLGILLLAAALVLGVTNCAPIQHTLSVRSTLGGSVAVPGEGDYFYGTGEVVELEAEAEQGYRFVNWTGDMDTIADVEAASTTITMNGDYEITANFEEVYELEVSSTEGGSVTTPGEGVFTYEAGAVVSLMASPASGHRFVDWTGDVDTIADVEAASTTITINGDYSITANFVAQYVLTIGSTEGGDVINPGEGTFTYDAGTMVNLVAEADEGYKFMEWTGDVHSVTDVTAASTTVTINGRYSIIANFAKEIRDWHDLDAVRDNLSGHYVLVNDLDSTTAGYAELAGPAANNGKGWEPIAAPIAPDPFDHRGPHFPFDTFNGSFDGQRNEVRDLFIDRPGETGVGLFGFVGEGGIVKNVSAMDIDVSGGNCVGGLVGWGRWGTMKDSHASGSVSGDWDVGGLVGDNHDGTVSNSYFSGSVTGGAPVGGLVGRNSHGTVISSHFGGSVTGHGDIGGLVGFNAFAGHVINSYYNYDEVTINGENLITIGALYSEDFEQWLANDKHLNINERLTQKDGYYLIDDTGDLKALLPFGQDSSLKFRLENDLDLVNEPNFYIPYLAGVFDGNGHKISGLYIDFDSVSMVGLFGFLAPNGKVTQLGVDTARIAGVNNIGSLVGWNDGTVSNCYSTASVNGWANTGGLVGCNAHGTLSNSYFRGSVTAGEGVGGLVGSSFGPVNNSYYSYDEVLINGRNMVTIGALSNEDFEQWLANDKFLDINERLAQEDGYYLIDDVNDFKSLLAFGQDGALKFRLTNDLDLSDAPDFYIPYLGGEFDGNGHKVSNLNLSLDWVSHVGLFGVLARSGKITQLGVIDAHITGWSCIGSLVGTNWGSASLSYSRGSVTGQECVGGLVGENVGILTNSYSTGSVTAGGRVGGLVGLNAAWGNVSNSYSSASVTGIASVGGLVGDIWLGTVSNSISTGTVTGDRDAGGLVGSNTDGTVRDSLWDIEASGQPTSAGGVGKTTAQMKSILTFSTATWSITAVASCDTRNTAYLWNIVDGETYPFLSWQSVS